MASLGEETRASCRGPANHNAVALILPHKAMLGFHGGAIGADIHVDRTGILAGGSWTAPRFSTHSRTRNRATTIHAIPEQRCRDRRCLIPAMPVTPRCQGAGALGAFGRGHPRVDGLSQKAPRPKSRSLPRPPRRSNRCSAGISV